MIHCFTFKGINIVLDVSSNSVHVVDDCCRDILVGSDLARWPKDEIASARAELSELERMGQLNSAEDVSEILYRGKNVVKALCMHVAHDCNLRCTYCFAGTGAFGKGRQLMTLETAKQSVDYLIEASGNRQHCEIDFFGGEPLLNIDVVRSVTKYIREKEIATGKIFKLTLTTNAVALNDEIIEFLNANNIALVLSIDGRKSVHDAVRPDCGGQGSYERVLKNIKKAVDSRNGANYYVRGTFTAKNLQFSEDVAHLIGSGFFEVSVEPVVTEFTELQLRDEHFNEIANQYEIIAEYLYERRRDGNNINFFHYNIDLEHGPCIAKRLNGCGAGNDYLAVDPDGALYPCHQFVGREEYVVGDIVEGIKNATIGQSFQASNVYAKEDCVKCWAKYFCSGGCHANNLAANKDLLKPYKLGCAMQKKRLEMALWLKAMEFLDNCCE